MSYSSTYIKRARADTIAGRNAPSQGPLAPLNNSAILILNRNLLYLQVHDILALWENPDMYFCSIASASSLIKCCAMLHD